MVANILKRGRKALATLAVGALLMISIVPAVSAETTTSSNNGNTTNLGELIILSELFDNNEDGSGLFGNGDSNLGELIILAEVFGNNGNSLFGDGGSLFGGDSNLGELIILSELFSGDDEDGGGFDNLIELFILSELFNQQDDTEQPTEPEQPEEPTDDDDETPADTVNFIRTGELSQSGNTWRLTYDIPGTDNVRSNLSFDSSSTCTNANGATVSCSSVLTAGATVRVTGNYTSSNNTVDVSTMRVVTTAPQPPADDDDDTDTDTDTVNFIRTGPLSQEDGVWILTYDTSNLNDVESNLEFDSGSTCTNVNGQTVDCDEALAAGATARVTGNYTSSNNTVNVSTLRITQAAQEEPEQPEQRTVQLYTYVSRLDNGQCTAAGVRPVTRQIPFTNTPVQDTIRLLLQGQLTSTERAQGFETDFPLPGVSLVGANLVNGALTLELSPQTTAVNDATCGEDMLMRQIRQTALQFDAVDSVTITPSDPFNVTQGE